MADSRYDVFLSHNSKDKPAVERIAEKLRENRLEPWLDSYYLPVGKRFQAGLVQALLACDACAVFIGPHGLGAWQVEEIGVAQDLAAKNPDYSLFIVLLPGLPDPYDPSTEYYFLNMRTWVDFRRGFEDPDHFQRLINAVLGLPMGPTMPVVLESGESPYRGLHVFDEEHAKFFFGREAEVQRLQEKVKASRFLAVVGPSGSGKSSLVRAGLLPALKNGVLPGSQAWPVRVFTPGGRPVDELAAHLVQIDPERAMGSTVAELRDSPQTLDLAATLLLSGTPPSSRLVLVIDQFEEIFTLCADEAERAHFLGNLLHAATVPNGRCLIILTLRADFYPRCAAYPELATLLAAHQVLVGPLDEQGLRAAIEQPARLVGASFEPGLVETILGDVGKEAGALPLLEHALFELWQRKQGTILSLAAYRESGGVDRALAIRADAVFDDLGEHEQAIARRVLLRLTQPGEETEDTRRRAELSELITRPSERESVQDVVNQLVAARLLTAGQQATDGDYQVDVVHEALIRAWPRLRTWLDEDREGLRTHRRLTDAAQEWERTGRDPDLLYRGGRLAEAQALAAGNPDLLNQQETVFLSESVALRERELALAAERQAAQERQRKRIIAGLTIFSLVALVLAGLAGVQWRNADAEKKRADGERATAVVAQGAAVAAQATSEAERLRADQQAVNAVASESTAVAEATRAAMAQTEAEAAEGTAVAEAARAEAETIRAESEAARAETAARVALARQLAAQSRGHTDDLDLGLLLAAEAHDLNPDDLEVRRSLLAATHLQPRLQGMLHGHQGTVRALAFSPDGRTLASGGDDGTLRLWDPAAKTVRGSALTGHGTVWSLAFGPNGQRVAFSSITDGAIQLWDPATGALGPAIRPVEGLPLHVAISPNGRLLAAGTRQGTIALWDPATGTPIGSAWPGHEGEIVHLTFSPNSATLISASVDDTVRFWDMTEGREGQALGAPLTPDQVLIAQILLSPDASTLATAGGDGTIRLWDVASGLPIGEPLTGHEDTVFRLAFSPDGARLFSSSDDGTIRQWEVATRQPIGLPIAAGQAGILGLALSPDGTTLASGGEDGTIRLWDVAAKPELFSSLSGHIGRTAAIAYSPDGTKIATGDEDGMILLWNAADGSQIGSPLPGHADVIWNLAFSPDGTKLASASFDGTIGLWDMASDEPRGARLLGHEGAVYAVAFSPAGDVLASGGYDGSVRLWRASDGAAAGDPLALPTTVYIYAVSFNPEGTVLAAADSAGLIRFWDIESRDLIGPPAATGQGVVFSICFVDAGERLISAGADGTIRSWDVTERLATPVAARAGSSDLGEVWTVDAHERQVVRLACTKDTPARVASGGLDGRVLVWTAGAATPEAELLPESDTGFEEVAFSAYGSRLAFTSTVLTSTGIPDRAAVTLWDVGEGSRLSAFPVLKLLTRLQFSPDGSRFAVGREDGRIVVWDAATGTMVAEQRLPADDGSVASLAFSPDNARLAVGSGSGGVWVWDVDAGTALSAPLGHHDAEVTALAFSAEGTALASGADDGTVRLWDLVSGEPGATFVLPDAVSGETTDVTVLAFTRDTSVLAAGGNRTIAFWDVGREELVGDVLQAGAGFVTKLAFTPDGRLLASGDENGVVHVWDVASRRLVAARVLDLPALVNALAISADGSLLAAGGETSGIALVALAADSAASLGQVAPIGDRIQAVAFAADGAWLTSIDSLGTVTRWNLTDAAWRRQACAIANRNLTRDEWAQYIGDPDDATRPYQATCPELPLPADDVIATPTADAAGPATPVAPPETV